MTAEPARAARRPTAVKRSWRRAVLAIVVAVALAGCASWATKATAPNASATTTPTEVRATDVARADPGSVSTAAVVEGINAFGHDLYTQAASGGNVVISPLSIEVALSMARTGAGGTTAAEIDEAMHFPSTGRDAQMNALTRDLATQDTAPPLPSAAASRDANAPPAAPILSIANALFVQQGFPIGQPFLNTMAADYGSGVRTVELHVAVRRNDHQRLGTHADRRPDSATLRLARSEDQAGARECRVSEGRLVNAVRGESDV